MPPFFKDMATLAKLSVTDEYFKEIFSFDVLDFNIPVSDENLATALKSIPAERRDIILLACCLWHERQRNRGTIKSCAAHRSAPPD